MIDANILGACGVIFALMSQNAPSDHARSVGAWGMDTMATIAVEQGNAEEVSNAGFAFAAIAQKNPTAALADAAKLLPTCLGIANDARPYGGGAEGSL